MLSEMHLVKYDTKILRSKFNVQVQIIPEYLAPFLWHPDLVQDWFITATVREYDSDFNLHIRLQIKHKI